jgi:hypothetical protein
MTNCDDYGIVSDSNTVCYLTQNEQFFSYTMARTSYNQWHDDDVSFVLDQHILLDLFSANSLKQQFNG